jgi:hypothetical protein
MQLPLSSGFNGKLGRVLDLILAELRAGRPVQGPGVLSGRTSLGSSRTAQPSAGGGGLAQFATVVNVNRDTLDVTQDGGDTTFTVSKPPALAIGGYNAADGAAVGAFESANTWPGTAPTDYDDYTEDYLMRYVEDATTIEGVQMRVRLVYASLLNSGVPEWSGASPRKACYEMVWPPFMTSFSGTGGPPADTAALGANGSRIAFVTIAGEKIDLNLHGRQWINQEDRKGERVTRTKVSGTVYMGRMQESGILTPAHS